MTWNCDPFGGWYDLGHIWGHCRGYEEGCVEVEFFRFSTTDPNKIRVIITPTWGDPFYEYMVDGDSITVPGDSGYEWKVECRGVNSSQQLASIYICYQEGGNGDDETDVEEGDEFNWRGHTIKILNIVCGPVNYVEAKIDGITKHLTFDENASSLSWFMAAVFPGPIIGGAVFIAVKSIASGCASAKLIVADAGLDEGERRDISDEIVDEGVVDADGNPIDTTPEEVEAANDQAYKEMIRHPDHDAALQKKVDGLWTAEELKAWETEWKKTRTIDIIVENYYADRFSLIVPSIVMAGDVDVTGTAPQANQKLQIKAVKKYWGFDWLAKDPVLAEVTSDADHKYKATINLDEFGVISIYAHIPKGWWGILDADIESERHTVWVLTWTVVIGLVAALALMYDKKMKGKFIGVFKKRR